MAAKIAYPNPVHTPPERGKKANTGKAQYPLPVGTKPVATGPKASTPNRAQTAAAPSKKGVANLPTIDPKVTGGILGNLSAGARKRIDAIANAKLGK